MEMVKQITSTFVCHPSQILGWQDSLIRGSNQIQLKHIKTQRNILQISAQQRIVWAKHTTLPCLIVRR